MYYIESSWNKKLVSSIFVLIYPTAIIAILFVEISHIIGYKNENGNFIIKN